MSEMHKQALRELTFTEHFSEALLQRVESERMPETPPPGSTKILLCGEEVVCSRVLVWGAFLGLFVPSSDGSVNIEKHALLRSQYTERAARRLGELALAEASDMDNPLSREPKICPEIDTRNQIKIDILRTGFLREMVNLHSETLFRLLFTWALENGPIGYRQGMSELAAFLLWVALTDSKADWRDPSTADILAPRNAELNAYLLFDALMRGKMRELYRFEEKGLAKKKEIPINKKSTFVFKRLLRAIDEPLYAHLDSCRFQPIISYLKWSRLLFLREFDIEQCLIVWDYLLGRFGLKVEIFDFRTCRPLKEDQQLQFLDVIDFLCVALYVKQRDRLMAQESEIGIVQILQEPVKTSALDVLLLAESLVGEFTRPIRHRSGKGEEAGGGTVQSQSRT